MISITVPAYNEEAVIEDFINAVETRLKLDEPWELLIVNDGSKDNTAAIVQRLQKDYKNLRLVSHEVNQNLGGALRTCFKEAKGDIIVTMDSDLTHPPELIPDLIHALREANADVAIASRYAHGGGMENVPGWRVALSVAFNRTMGLLMMTRVKDITAGFKAYRADLVKSLHLKSRGFEIQMEIMTRLFKKRAKFVEIPLMLRNREKGASKFNFFRAAPKYGVNVSKLFLLRWFG